MPVSPGEIACFNYASAVVIGVLASVIGTLALKVYNTQEKRVETATGSANFWRDMYLNSIVGAERAQVAARAIIEATADRRGAV